MLPVLAVAVFGVVGFVDVFRVLSPRIYCVVVIHALFVLLTVCPWNCKDGHANLCCLRQGLLGFGLRACCRALQVIIDPIYAREERERKGARSLSDILI